MTSNHADLGVELGLSTAAREAKSLVSGMTSSMRASQAQSALSRST